MTTGLRHFLTVPAAAGMVALTLLCASAQQMPDLIPLPEPAPAPGTTPASDKEETGSLTDLLPDYKDPLTLPAEEASSVDPNSEAARDLSLFPPELWSGEHTSVPPPDAPLPAAPAASPAIVDSPVLSPDVAASCFGPSPPPPLHDPQNLLTPAQSAPLFELIQQSLNDRGSFQTSVVILKPSQQIPVALNPPELLQNWYGDNKGLLILYFYGKPERTLAFFSPATRQHHRSEDLRQVVDFSVREASRMTAPLAQLQRFCYKSAIRLDRLHRQGVVPPDEEPAPVPAAPPPPPPSLWWAFAVGVHAAALAIGGVWWWRRRRKEPGKAGAPVFFPEQELVARLGAPHCGGSGAVMHFGASSPRI